MPYMMIIAAMQQAAEVGLGGGDLLLGQGAREYC